MTGGLVEFRSTLNPEWTTIGRIENDGTFKLATMSGGQTSQGALSGAHRVTIVPPPDDAQQQSAQPPITLPDPVQITPGENNHIELRLPAAP